MLFMSTFAAGIIIAISMTLDHLQLLEWPNHFSRTDSKLQSLIEFISKGKQWLVSEDATHCESVPGNLPSPKRLSSTRAFWVLRVDEICGKVTKSDTPGWLLAIVKRRQADSETKEPVRFAPISDSNDVTRMGSLWHIILNGNTGIFLNIKSSIMDSHSRRCLVGPTPT